MTGALKAFIARHWPVLRLRTILLGTLLFVAALPGVGAIFLRVYENALVRRTEAELVAQSAALAASAAVLWGNRPTQGDVARDPGIEDAGDDPYGLPFEGARDRSTEIDLRSSPILPPRPAPVASRHAPDPQALAIAHQLEPALAETRETTLSAILMLDRNGTILTGRDTGRSLAALPEVRAALAGQASTVLRINEDYRTEYAFEWLSRAANIRLHHARPIRVNGQVAGALLVSRSPRALFRGMYEDRGKIALGVLLIFMTLVALSGILSRAIVRPIENLTRATRMLASGRAAHLGRPSLQVVEIRDLFDDFEQMAERIDKRSRYLRDFAAAVSHEFKTPLAGIGGAVELLQDHGAAMTDAERERFLGNIAADAQRLSRLVRRLMEQAQADVQAGSAEASVDPGPVLATVADGLRHEGFQVDIVQPDLPPRLSIDARVLESLLCGLAENAQQAGASSLRISLTTQRDLATFDLIDNGAGIAEGDRGRIFDPFFTSKRESGGTGLGLSIARSLIEGAGGSIVLCPSAQGAHFRMTCPRT
jgi:signal transduction histidine kinase